MKWYVWSDRDKNDPEIVESWGNYYYSCTCAQWQMNNDRFNPKAVPGWCQHIRSINGSKVTVKFRKYGYKEIIENEKK